MDKNWSIRLTMSLVVTLMASVLVSAQDTKEDADERSRLGVRHAKVERMMQDLERKFTALAERLQETEPERAKRLVATLQEAKKMLLSKRLSEITELLDDSELESAISAQEEVISDLKRLIKLLLDEDDKDASEEEKELKYYQEKIKSILKDQKANENESNKIANKDNTLKKLDAQIKSVEQLIKKQQDVNSETESANGKGIQAIDRAANRQHKVRKDTEKTADDIAGVENPWPMNHS